MFKSIARIALIAALAFAAVGCSKVDPGHVGIRVKAFGGGVQTDVVEPGKYVWNGPGYSMYEYPVFKQTTSWTAKEGTAFTFQTVEGLSVGADVGITYSVGHNCVAKFFSEFRVPIETVTDTFVHNTVRQALNDNASSMKMEAVYGAGKVDLFKRVTRQVQASLGPKCLNVDDVYLLSNLSLPDQVRGAITAKLAATQMAEQRQNELAQSQAEAAKEVAVAEGAAKSKILAAEAEAKSISIRGAALRDNPALVDLTIAEAWDGHLPQQYLGGDSKGTILQLLAK
jgi:regulator of protease activity HflC (stomatin/prohibitin superfamily)